MNAEIDRDRLASIIREIALSPDGEWPKKKLSFAKELSVYYSSNNLNLYSSTYEWLSNNDTEDDLEYLYERLSELEDFFRNNPFCQPYLDKFVKLEDYIRLEGARAINNHRLVNAAAEATQLGQEIRMLKNEVQEDRKNASSQSVTVLGIFTGIAVTFFSGISLLSNAFGQLSSENFLQISMIAIIIGFILFNTVYILIYAAGRISGSQMCAEGHTDCKRCGNIDSCEKIKFVFFRLFARLYKKYTLVVMINFIFILFFAIMIFFTYRSSSFTIHLTF